MKGVGTGSVVRWFATMTPWKGILLLILCLGASATVIRFTAGLGAATNLSDSFPWGLWIGFDILVGVGLAAGGFVIAATVHVFKIEKYESIARPTILTAFLGYLLVIVALMFDLGRPYRIWHPLIMWNPHSVMFEIGRCVTLYTTVLALEFSPLIFERFGLRLPLRMVRAAYIPLVIAGVLLSTLHQSSLGTLYVIAPDKLHGLWYSPMLPIFFFISAIAGGLAMTIFESFMTFRAFGKRLETNLLQGLGRVIVVVLGLYAIWRLEDLFMRGGLALSLKLTPESVLFWGEMGLGVLLPMTLFAIPVIRRTERGLFIAAVFTILGFVVNRLNVAITGMTASSGVTYIPSWMELAVTVSVVALGFVLFGLAVKHLPVFPRDELSALAEPDGEGMRSSARPVLSRGTLAVMWSLLLAGFIAVTVSAEGGSAVPVAAEPAAANSQAAFAGELSLPEPYTFPPSVDSPGPVTFSHETHVDPERPSCGPCHQELFMITSRGKPQFGRITYSRVHEGDLCASCHDGERSFAVEDDCTYCHQAE